MPGRGVHGWQQHGAAGLQHFHFRRAGPLGRKATEIKRMLVTLQNIPGMGSVMLALTPEAEMVAGVSSPETIWISKSVCLLSDSTTSNVATSIWSDVNDRGFEALGTDATARRGSSVAPSASAYLAMKAISSRSLTAATKDAKALIIDEEACTIGVDFMLAEWYFSETFLASFSLWVAKSKYGSFVRAASAGRT